MEQIIRRVTAFLRIFPREVNFAVLFDLISTFIGKMMHLISHSHERYATKKNPRLLLHCRWKARAFPGVKQGSLPTRALSKPRLAVVALFSFIGGVFRLRAIPV